MLLGWLAVVDKTLWRVGYVYYHATDFFPMDYHGGPTVSEEVVDSGDATLRVKREGLKRKA